ncbi:MAG: zinc ABC transporter substrate-binding protein [Dehalococcoidia bacterium]|nr:zinc ABC transporter substrate-binding protein [Dehalococcoidia bacterium]
MLRNTLRLSIIVYKVRLWPKPVAAALLIVFSFAACSAESPIETGKTSVVTSFYPVQFLAERIGGSQVSVKTLVPAGAEPHNWEPSPKEIAAIQNAKVFIYQGIVEKWADRVVSDMNTTKTIVVKGITGQELRDSNDEEISGKDPHVWLDPIRYAQEADAIYAGMAKADPANAAAYKTNLDTLKIDLHTLDTEFKNGLSNCDRTTIVTSHAAFAYLAQRYELKQLAVSGITPDAEPSPARLRKVLEELKAKKATHIFFETLVSPRISKTLADEAGIETLVLNPLEGLTEKELNAGDNYVTVMKNNLANLRLALGCR